jgi:hypothetical protein
MLVRLRYIDATDYLSVITNLQATVGTFEIADRGEKLIDLNSLDPTLCGTTPFLLGMEYATEKAGSYWLHERMI